MMFRIGNMGYVATEDAQVVSIPLDGRETALVVVLPKQRGGLAAVEKKLTAETFEGWRKRLRHQRVSLKLPKFRFETPLDLGETLADMGMADAFAPRRADFRGMTKAEPLYISAVLHKAFIDVHEEGLEAAAATLVMMGPGAAARPPKPAEFVADHPFLFFIVHHHTRCVLFAGRVSLPTPAK